MSACESHGTTRSSRMATRVLSLALKYVLTVSSLLSSALDCLQRERERAREQSGGCCLVCASRSGPTTDRTAAAAALCAHVPVSKPPICSGSIQTQLAPSPGRIMDWRQRHCVFWPIVCGGYQTRLISVDFACGQTCIFSLCIDKHGKASRSQAHKISQKRRYCHPAWIVYRKWTCDCADDKHYVMRSVLDDQKERSPGHAPYRSHLAHEMASPTRQQVRDRRYIICEYMLYLSLDISLEIDAFFAGLHIRQRKGLDGTSTRAGHQQQDARSGRATPGSPGSR